MILECYNHYAYYTDLMLWSWVWLIFWILWIVVAVFVAVWVYRDAKRNCMEPALWLIIVLVAGLIGLVIYLIVRKNQCVL